MAPRFSDEMSKNPYRSPETVSEASKGSEEVPNRIVKAIVQTLVVSGMIAALWMIELPAMQREGPPTGPEIVVNRFLWGLTAIIVTVHTVITIYQLRRSKRVR